jgi:type I restriction enzyme S subunit
MRYVEISDVDPINGIVGVTEIDFGDAPSRARRLVRQGDVIVSTVRTYLRAIAPIIGSETNTVVSTGFAVMRPRSVNAAYLAYILRAEFVISEIISRSVGVSYPAINASAISHISVPIPSLSEQQAIVAFLDREIGKIDALVAEQEQLIALLQEKQRAVITQAVTKGLDAGMPFRPSGIGWMGDIPAHWRVTPLMHLTDVRRPIMYGIVLPGPDVGIGIPILKGGNVKPSRMSLQEMARTTPEIEAPYARARLASGDLVYSIRGTIGDCEVVPPELEAANITQDVARVAVRQGVCAAWVRWALLSSPVRAALACGSLGAAVRGINIFDLKRVRLPTPPREEQVAISDFIEAEISQIEKLRVEAAAVIPLLQERRSALISAAVTGKIDVRGLVEGPVEQAVAA